MERRRYLQRVRLILAIVWAFLPGLVLAADSFDLQDHDPTEGATIGELLCNFAAWTFSIAVAAAVVAFLVAAYFYLTANGRPQRIESGKKALFYAAMGTAVVLLAWGAANIVADAIGGSVTMTGCESAGDGGGGGGTLL